MSDSEEFPFAAWFSKVDDRIHVELEKNSFDIRDILHLRYQLDVAIQDYTKAAGR